ncbi:hypothetical protein BGM26_16830 [Bacillus sp. FJAT-29790]|uniref:hypothetical protein n=1 Tax=Bacillus sp. FJAT-29790 TaxID=1895002 RepID=UPI001C233682|nr:hypothetical protein [Bacillus sp. FJAT-29790]MBU8880621.1 hypothetical protein [Bacillus sp. FJAT-29790]
MLKKWLKKNSEDFKTYSFSKVEFIEATKISDELMDYIGSSLLEAFRDINLLKDSYKDEPKESLIRYLKNYAFSNIEEPTREQNIRKNVRQGDFGETIAMEVVRKFDNFDIPIYKVRWKFNNNRSVFCTDMISHNIGNTITDLRYYEIKSRVTMKKEKVKIKDEDKSHYVGVVAHQSLLKDELSPNTESIADFLFRYSYNLAVEFEKHGVDIVAQEYYAAAAKYCDIVKHPEKYNRSFEIIIIVEKSLYNEDILKELHDLPIQLNPLEVKIILIDNLKDLFEKSYERAIEIAVKKVFEVEENRIL